MAMYYGRATYTTYSRAVFIVQEVRVGLVGLEDRSMSADFAVAPPPPRPSMGLQGHASPDLLVQVIFHCSLCLVSMGMMGLGYT